MTDALEKILVLQAPWLEHGPVADVLHQHYDIKAASDGASAWQAILLDTHVRVVVADAATANPVLHDLLRQIRGSRVPRIREIPILLLTSDAVPDNGASGPLAVAIDRTNPEAVADELLRRLQVLVELAVARDAMHDAQAQVESARTIDPETEMLLLPEFDRQLNRLVEHSRAASRDIAVICLGVELKLAKHESWDGEREQRLKAIARIISTTIRLEDLSCRTDSGEFCVATSNSGTTDMLRFASRLRKVLENTDSAGPGIEVWTYIGIATLSEDFQRDSAGLRFHAQKRARQAVESHSRRILVGSNLEPTALAVDAAGGPQSSMDINLALALIQSDRSDEVVPHLPLLLKRLGPLFRLIHEQQRRIAARTGSGSAEAPPL